MDLSFGARLRLQRERVGVPLATIAERTKIKVSLLEGLERGDVSSWPGGIFRRSYFRDYAHAIGLDAEMAVREFLERFPDPNDEFTSDPAEPAAETSRWPTTRLRYLIDSAVGALPALRPAAPVRGGRVSIDASATDDGVSGIARDRTEESPRLRPGGDAEVPAPAAPEASAPRVSPARPTRTATRVDFGALAELCTRLAALREARDLAPAIADAAGILDAVGLIVWTWDARAGALVPSLAHGYADDLLRQLPRVAAGADNAIAAAFLSTQPRVVAGAGDETGAIVAPLLTPGGCAGVLAIELRGGAEHHDAVRAAVTILAAQLAALVGGPAMARAQSA